MSVLLVTGDLAVISRVQGAAANAGVPLVAASQTSHALDSCATGECRLLILDLSSSFGDIATFVDQIRAAHPSTPQIIAFGPHVHTERLSAAQQAGCDVVLSRGQFFSQLDAILRR